MPKSETSRFRIMAALSVAAVSGLLVLSQRNYLLFHVLIEILVIAIACSVFLFAWNVRQFQNSFLSAIGSSFAWISLFELLHLVSYKGMNLIGNDANLPTQLWIASRYLLSLSILAAPWFVRRAVPVLGLFLLQGGVTLVLIASIFTGVFPDCYIEGEGLTRFKVISEYIVVLLMMTSLLQIRRNAEQFEPRVLKLLSGFLGALVLSELCFTAYISVFGIMNSVGHILMAVAFGFLYKAILESSIRTPLELLFRDLNEANHRWKTTLDHIHEAIFIHELDGSILEVNERMLELYGVSRSEATKFSVERDYSGPTSPLETLPEIWKSTLNGESHLFEWQARRPHTGELFDVEVFLTRFELNGKPRIVATVRDISDRKALDAQLKQKTEALETALASRDEFISVASHELKTPLTALRLQFGLLQAFRKGGAAQAAEDPRFARVFDLCSVQLDRLCALIDNLLDVTRIRVGKIQYHPEKLNVTMLLNDIADRFKENVKQAGSQLTLAVEADVAAYWDKLRIEQVIVNLLSNALRHAPRAPITVRVSRLPEPDLVQLVVEDQGPGIPPEDQSRIFERLENGLARDRNAGLGMGLYIAKHIVEGHKGTLSLESEVGKGSRFVITLPVQPVSS